MEVTLEEARAHLGIETQRQWNDLAISRTTLSPLRVIFGGDADDQCLAALWGTRRAHRCLVCQSVANLRGRDCRGQTRGMECVFFFKVGS